MKIRVLVYTWQKKDFIYKDWFDEFWLCLYKVWTKSLPDKWKANTSVRNILKKYFWLNLDKDIILRSGQRSNKKLFELKNI